MCGIGGVIYAGSPPPDAGRLAALSTSLAHRGPDGSGTFRAPGVALVHRRLAVIDPTGAAQPMATPGGTHQITYSGEIYNFRELRRDLEARGHRFRTQSDTEVVLNLVAEYGAAGVTRLRGMFAFGIWDAGRRQLFLARDRLGIKPLYLARVPGAVWFASEPHALAAAGVVAPEPDPLAVDDYFAFGMTLAPRSFFRGVEQLPPGHALLIEPGDLAGRPRRYWSLAFDPDPKPDRDWESAVRDAVDEAVGAHLVADVPVGAFLSGGVDSGAVVASAARQSAAPLSTFAIGFDQAEYCELPYSRLVAGAYGTRHEPETLKPDMAGWLDLLTRAFDEPLADVSAVPTLMASRLAARSVKVALSGDGGDEAFGGYPRYVHDDREDRVRRRLPDWLRTALGYAGRAWPPAEAWPKPLRLKTALTNLSLPAAAAYANTLTLCRQPLRHRLVRPEFVRAVRGRGHLPAEAVRAAFAAGEPAGCLAGMMSADLSVVVPDDYLVKVDRASMYFGLEVRPPLLDHRLLEFAAGLPADWRVRGGRTKWGFRRAMAGRLAPDLLSRRKTGFVIPVDEWLRPGMPLHALLADVLASPSAPLDRFVDRRVGRKVFADHSAGRGGHGRLLWAILVLARWADRYLRPGATDTR
jgi:asparagine synthase (glutamine-hydrolysing)